MRLPPSTGSPRDMNRWKYRGIALAELQRCEESLAELEKADGERPEQAEIWYWKGQVLPADESVQGGDPGLSSRNPDKAGLFRGLGKHRGNHDKPRAQSGCRQRLGQGKKNNRIPQVKNGHSPEVFRVERDLAPCINSGINLLKERISITLLKATSPKEASRRVRDRHGAGLKLVMWYKIRGRVESSRAFCFGVHALV